MTQITAGTVVDQKYKIISLLGAGGFGNVYLAQQIGFDRQVALKLLEQASVDAEIRGRFEREAKILSTVQHPGIVSIYGFGQDEFHRPYLAMQYIQGDTLQRRLNNAKLTWKEVQDIGIQSCRALAAAHAAGVIHRDLKPANLMICQNPDQTLTVIVLDFGLSAVASGRFDSDAQKLTQTGLLLGTPDYMSPEICRGRKADSRSDIYSLGCILYQCLTGQPPFECDSPMGLVYQHATSLPARIAGIPEDLERVIFKALQKEPEDRFASMEDFASALSRVGDGLSCDELKLVKLSDRAPLKAPAKWRLLLLCGTLSAAVVLAGVWTARQGWLTADQLALHAVDPEILRGEAEFDRGNFESATQILMAARRKTLSVEDASRLSDDLCQMARMMLFDEPDPQKFGLMPSTDQSTTAGIIADAAADACGNALSQFQTCKSQILVARARIRDPVDFIKKLPIAGLTEEQRRYCLALCDELTMSMDFRSANPDWPVYERRAIQGMRQTPHSAQLMIMLQDAMNMNTYTHRLSDNTELRELSQQIYPLLKEGNDRLTGLALAMFAQQAFLSGDKHLAYNAADRALAIGQNHAFSRYYSACCYHIRGSREMAEDHLGKAIRDLRIADYLGSKCKFDGLSLEMLSDEAECHLRMGKRKQAIECYQRALDKIWRPDSPDPGVLKADLQRRASMEKTLATLYTEAGDQRAAQRMNQLWQDHTRQAEQIAKH